MCVASVLYTAVTPRDYQPPGFKEADGDTFVFAKEPVKLTMGEVATPYHYLKLHMATERQRLEQVGVGQRLSLTVATRPVNNEKSAAFLQVEESFCQTETYALRMEEEDVQVKVSSTSAY